MKTAKQVADELKDRPWYQFLSEGHRIELCSYVEIATLTALAAIDAGKRWRDVLKEFER